MPQETEAEQLNFTAEHKERLDLALASSLANFSRSRLQSLITEGHIQINGKICQKKNTLVNLGDMVTVNIPPSVALSEVSAQDIPLDILYEDDCLIVLNKPAGLVVHPAPGHPDGTLVNALLAHCQDLKGIGGVERPGIVHRLDRDTTGAIVVAKSDFAHQALQQQLKEKTAKREYLGIIHGVPKTNSGTVDLPIGRHRIDRKKMAIATEGGRESVTHWKVQERLGSYTLMNFSLETGRTHQIRVHLSHIGHPLVGDRLYGAGRSLGVNISGQALHACKLTLIHPKTQEILAISAPAPESFTKLLTLLRLRSRS
jgi:23S rRNA pseudouridine1911/1915/1917 synthase